MALTRQNPSAFKRRKKSYTGLILLIIGVIAIIACGSFAVVYMALATVDSAVDRADIPMTCYVAGNDLIVAIQPGGSSQSLTMIELTMEGYTLPPGHATKVVQEGDVFPKKIEYTDVASGIYGDLNILFKGVFTDGSKKTIWTGIIKFT